MFACQRLVALEGGGDETVEGWNGGIWAVNDGGGRVGNLRLAS